MNVPTRAARRLAGLLALLTCGVASAQPPPAPVVVAPVVSQRVAATQTFVGTVRPLRRVTVGSAVDGRVTEFPVEEGQRVEAGEKLAQLLTETISLELAAAEAQLELRQQQLLELKNGSRPEEIEQTRARMAAAEARRDYQRARRNRTQVVFQKGRAISEEEHEEAIAAALEAEQLYLEAEAEHQLAVKGPRAERLAQAAAEVAIERAIVDRLRDQLTKHTIISRFAGYVTAEYTEVGAWVAQGDPVADVVAIDEVEVVAQVVEQGTAFVKPGQEVPVQIPALGDRVFIGRVSRIVPQGDDRARTFPVKVLVPNEITDSAPLLKPGMYARVSLPVAAPGEALLAPKDAVVLGGPSPIVFAVDGAGATNEVGTVRPVPVRLGVAIDSKVQITGELQPGTLVVVEGNERLRPAQQVRIARVAAD